MLIIQAYQGGGEWPFLPLPHAAQRLTLGEWQLAVVLDHSHQLLRLADGLLIHDGRCTLQGDPAAPDLQLNGAYLHVQHAHNGLQITTDRLATIPLYMAQRDGSTLLSSRLLDLARAGWNQPDPLGVYQWVLLGQPLGGSTPLAGVCALPNASVVRFGGAGEAPRRESYWQLPPTPAAQADVRDFIEPAINLLRSAHQRHRPREEHKWALPVTGGFDSRCNLALWSDKVASSLLFHTEDLGRYELPIARQIAAYYRQPLVVYSSLDWMAHATKLDLALETGEFNAAHWRLADTARRLAEEHGAQASIDGFLQDFLFKASFVSEAPPQALFDGQMGIARYRAQFLGIAETSRPFQALTDSVALETLRGEEGWIATQRYYLENRSRRLVYNIVRLNQNYLDIKTPGLDHELMDFGVSLPRSLRKNALLYRHVIHTLDPDLARITYDKSGLPIMDLRRRSWPRRLRGPLMRNLNRIWPERRFFRESETNFAKLLRESTTFRQQLDAHISASQWIRELFGRDVMARLEVQRRQGRPVDDMVGAMVTLAALELQARA